MVCTDQYLGMLTPDTIVDLEAHALPVSEAQLTLARLAWRAFRSDTPAAWYALLDGDTGALPFLAGAVERLLQEYPHVASGLSRTASTSLELLAVESL